MAKRAVVSVVVCLVFVAGCGRRGRDGEDRGPDPFSAGSDPEALCETRCEEGRGDCLSASTDCSAACASADTVYEDAVAEANAEGCGGAFDAYFECTMSTPVCAEASEIIAACEDEYAAYADCTSGSSGGSFDPEELCYRWCDVDCNGDGTVETSCDNCATARADYESGRAQAQANGCGAEYDAFYSCFDAIPVCAALDGCIDELNAWSECSM